MTKNVPRVGGKDGIRQLDAQSPGSGSDCGMHGAREGSRAEQRILDLIAGVDVPIVLIDGFSGAGKSTLADRLVRAWKVRRGIRPQLLRLELVYPGWDGLEAASEALLHDVLEPVVAGLVGSWQRWDWNADAPAERHPIDPSIPLIIEGVGSLSRANRALAHLGVWVELDAAERRRRAIERDGEAYRPHWERWARQEREFADRERPRDLADLVVDLYSVLPLAQDRLSNAHPERDRADHEQEHSEHPEGDVQETRHPRQRR